MKDIEKTYDLIEVLEELKQDNNKVFKYIDERENYATRYTVNKDEIVSITFRNKEAIEMEILSASGLLKRARNLRYIEVQCYGDVINNGDFYYFVNSELEIEKGKFDNTIKRNRNMFSDYDSAEKALQNIMDAFKISW